MTLRRSKVGDVEITEIDLSDAVVGAEKQEKAKPDKKPAWLSRANANLELYDFKKEYKDLPFEELFERFNRLVAFFYFADPTIAGIHTACLARSPGAVPSYYAAVHRYDGPHGAQKRVAASHRGPELCTVVRELVGIWIESLKYTGKEPTAQQGDLTDILKRSLDAVKEKKAKNQ